MAYDKMLEHLFYINPNSSIHKRITELLETEKEVARLKGMLASWEIFRNGISEQYPELLKWCPQNTITIHDPELPGVVIVDSVK